MAAAVDRYLAAVLEARLGGDVDDPGGAQAVLRRQGAGHEIDVGRQARAQGLPEHRKALGQDHIIQPVLDVGVIAADVELAKGILHDAGRLQDHLVQRDILAAGQDVHQLLGKRIGGCSQRGLDRLASGVQALRRHHDIGTDGPVTVRGEGRGCGR